MSRKQISALSDAANAICAALFRGYDYTTIRCPNSGLRAEPTTNLTLARRINREATGTFYVLANYVYVRCADPLKGAYISVHKQKGGNLVGKVSSLDSSQEIYHSSPC